MLEPGKKYVLEDGSIIKVKRCLKETIEVYDLVEKTTIFIRGAVGGVEIGEAEAAKLLRVATQPRRSCEVPRKKSEIPQPAFGL